jgi:superfamily II DNA or RNA helicase
MRKANPLINLKFDKGTLLLDNITAAQAQGLAAVVFDARSNEYRCPANNYRDLILNLRSSQIEYDDRVRAYVEIDGGIGRAIEPRLHQKEALASWLKNGKMGVVSLPTGAGKTILAVLAIREAKRSTLIVVPTIDLLHQWQAVLTMYFNLPIGLLGGGNRDLQEITVATYDSALLTIPHYGAKFGLLIFDECHHLPAPQYQDIARAAIAPFRLGLSATVERSDGKEEVIYKLLGPLVYEARIDEMVSNVLSPYDIVSIQVPLSESEQEEYQLTRGVYTNFVRRCGVDFNSPRGWMDFVIRSSRSPEGRDAMKAYRRQKQLANSAEGKFSEVWKILNNHKLERIIIFTSENSLAYALGQKFIIPVLTHHTKPKERRAMLDAFKSGELTVLATSKVLNEGVDVPDASIGVVLSGSGAVREHVQRLGRVLRFRPGKRAILYEITSKGTAEKYVSERRRQHHAYQGSP